MQGELFFFLGFVWFCFSFLCVCLFMFIFVLMFVCFSSLSLECTRQFSTLERNKKEKGNDL